ncbi:MAG: hypothetical protein Q6373_002120, partial [Candidatus Sigynarchaeota archaeon]
MLARALYPTWPAHGLITSFTPATRPAWRATTLLDTPGEHGCRPVAVAYLYKHGGRTGIIDGTLSIISQMPHIMDLDHTLAWFKLN